MPNKRKESISTILLGDALGELVEQLDIGDGSDKLIAILVEPDGVRLAIASGLSKCEVLGSLYLAIDEVIAMGDL